MSGRLQISRIVSGGQTGADRAALDVAHELGIDYGGWCPAGGWAEDFPEPPGLLTSLIWPTPYVQVRTRLNVRDSDATLIVWDARTRSPGTQLTMAIAEELGRPLLVTTDDADAARMWLDGISAQVGLNVAGPRESHCPGTYARTVELLRAVLAYR